MDRKKTSDWIESIKEGANSVYHSAWKIIRDTPIEIALLGATGFALGLSYGVSSENQRERNIPLAFSEIGQMEDDSESGGQHFGQVSRFYAVDNDARMKIFEAWNKSWQTTDTDNQVREFAHQLKQITDPYSKNFRYCLSDLLEEMPQNTTNALTKLDRFTQVLPKVTQLNNSLDSAWEDTHRDNYHTELYTVTVTTTDANGNTSFHTELRSRSVYDDTTHRYTFIPDFANAAGDTLKDILEIAPVWPEDLRSPSRVNYENERAIKSTGKKDKNGEEITPSELEQIAKKWNSGSTYNVNKEDIICAYSAIAQDTDKYLKSIVSATQKGFDLGISYKTRRHHDSGPEEFQINELMEQNGKKLEAGLTKVLDGIYQSRDDAEKLSRLIPEYISSAFGSGRARKEGKNPEELQEEIMKITREGYNKNFPGGLDVDGFRGGMVFLAGLVGLLLGGFAGFGLDRGIDYLTRKNSERDSRYK